MVVPTSIFSLSPHHITILPLLKCETHNDHTPWAVFTAIQELMKNLVHSVNAGPSSMASTVLAVPVLSSSL